MPQFARARVVFTYYRRPCQPAALCLRLAEEGKEGALKGIGLLQPVVPCRRDVNRAEATQLRIELSSLRPGKAEKPSSDVRRVMES